MAEAIVTDWLADYSALQPSELNTFAVMHENNQEITDALYTILNERLKYPYLIHSICHQFYSFYRSDEEILKRFTLQFIPVLIYIYLSSVAIGDKKSCRSVETLLISVYNVEVSTEDGGQKVVSFRMPVLAQASIYHEEKSLHTTDLRRWEENSNRDVKWGPLQQVESINAQNRMKVMTALLFAYNQQLCLMQKSTLFHLCKIVSQIVNQGFSKPGHAHRSSYGSDPNSSIMPKPIPRIPVSSQFLLEFVHAIYFAMFNEFGTIAIQTLDDIHNRACYELFSDLIVVTNAIRNSLHANPSGQPSDGPMGLSVALTPATNTVTVSKSMITNASFRTKKLPDDIPIQGVKDEGATLMSITEEAGEQTANVGNRNTAARSSKDGLKPHKVLMAGFKKSKDKEKDSKPASGKNGNVIETKEAKQTTKRDKLASRGSVQLTASGELDALDKTSPLTNLKSKIMESTGSVAISSTTTISDMVPLQNLANGGFNEEKVGSDSINNSCEASDSIDSSTDVSGSQRPSLALVDPHAHIQISQV